MVNGDGSLDEKVYVKSLSAKLFIQILDEVFLFFDVNQDDIAFRDRNDDGKISFIGFLV